MDATSAGREENGGKELFKQKTFKSLRNNINKLLWRRKSVTITQYDSTYKVSYLGNVLCGWTKGESCIDKPIKTLWSNYKQSSKPNVQMKITITQSGLKALTKQHGLTEYWSNRITYCVQPSQYPKVFCWIYRHEGRKLKQELRCHAVLCSKELVAKSICSELNLKLSQALSEFKKDKILKQNARLSLANCVYDNPGLPRRKLLLSIGSANYKPPLERSKSAPKLMAIEEDQEEEETEDSIDYKKYSNYCIQQYGGTLKHSRPHHHYNKFNSLKYNRSKSTISSLNRNNSLDSILESSANPSNANSCEKIYASCMSIHQLPDTPAPPPASVPPAIDSVEDSTASCSSTPVDEEPLTMNEQLSINFNPNYDQANEVIATDPNPNDQVKEYETHLNPKFNLLKTTAPVNSSHKLGKLLRNKSLDSILADNNATSYNSNRNAHRKSWCYGDEKTLSMMIDGDQHSKKQTSCCSSVEKLNQTSHAFSSFEHINSLIEQAVKTIAGNAQDSETVTNERRIDATPAVVKGVNKHDTEENAQLRVEIPVVQNNELLEDPRNTIEETKVVNTVQIVIKDKDVTQPNLVHMSRLLENNEISIDFDEFSMNTDEETNILNEFKYKKYSHHRLPSIESGFHDQIDSDSLLESNSESDNYESLNQNNVQPLGNNDETDNSIISDSNHHSPNKHLEAINEHVKTNHSTFKSLPNHYDRFDSRPELHKTNINIDAVKYDANANIEETSTKYFDTPSIDEPNRNYGNITSEDVKSICRNVSSSQNATKANRTSRILDKINSFNEKIESSHFNIPQKQSSVPHVSRLINKTHTTHAEENRLKLTNNNQSVNNVSDQSKENLSNKNQETTTDSSLQKRLYPNVFTNMKVTSEINTTDGTSKDNITKVSNDVSNNINNNLTLSTNLNLNDTVNNVDVEKTNQSVKNRIKEFNTLRKTPTTNSNSPAVIVKKLNSTSLPINNRVTITKTIRKISLTNNVSPEPNNNTQFETAHQIMSANKFGTLPKLKPTQALKSPFLPNNINSDINHLSQSLDYSVNLSNVEVKHVDKITKHEEVNKTLANQTPTQSDTSSLVKKRKQMFELSNPKTDGCLLRKNSTDEDNTNMIKNRRSLFENFGSLNHSVSCTAGFYNAGNACSNQGLYNGAARFMSSSEQDEDSDESGYVESQELETLQQVNNNKYVQV